MTELITKLKSWGQKLLLMVSGVIAGILIIETFAISTGFAVPKMFTLTHRYYYDFVQPDAQLGFKPKPNLRNFEVNLGDVKEIVNTDSYGFPNLGKDYTQSNLYFVGDSMTWGLWIEKEKIFSRLIELEIKQPVIKLAVPSYGFEQYEVLFRDWVVKYKPKTAVLSIYPNDLDKLSPQTVQNFYQVHRLNEYESLPWYKKSFLYQLIFKLNKKQNIIELPGANKKARNGLILYDKQMSIYKILGVGKDYLTSHANIQVEAALEQITDLTKENKVKLFVFLIPSKESTYIKDYAELFPDDVKYLESEQIGYERLCQLAKSKGVTCVDLTSQFRQHGEEEKLYFDNDCHWNIAGHKLAAQLILDTLKQEEGVDLTTDITAKTSMNQFYYIANHQVK